LAGLGINGGFLLAQIINFLIIFVAISALAWRPLVRVLEARRERIAKGLEDARAAEQARANAERDAQKVLDQARVESTRLVEEARGRGEDQARVITEQANRDAEAIRARARAEAEEQATSQLGQLRTQVAQLAIAAAERVIGQSLDQQKATQIVSDFFTPPPTT